VIDGITAQQIEQLLASTMVRCRASDLRESIKKIGVEGELIEQGVRELEVICSLVPSDLDGRSGGNLVVDLSLARGLDYYTGLIVEAGLIRYPEFGTVISGGRYDDLASEFTNERLPGVGVSIGLTRLMELLLSEGLVDTSRKSSTQLLVTVYSEEQRALCNRIAHQVRGLGVATEVYYKSHKLGKQIEYGEERGVRYVLFIDSLSGEMQVKDLHTKEQRAVGGVEELVRLIA
jgi:histidyl-tRNA synthetase